MTSPDRLNHRRDPFARHLKIHVRDLVAEIGIERVIQLAIGSHARADFEAGSWLTARLERMDDRQRTAAFGAIARVALHAMAVEVLRQYEAGELLPDQREFVEMWVRDQG